MGIIFNSVNTYIEQVGRKRSIRHWNTLDSLDVIFNGPTVTIEEWIPKIGQSHPEYPSMLMDSAEVVRQSADITELRITYVGKFYGIGPVAVGSATRWGETSYTTVGVGGFVLVVGSGNVTYFSGAGASQVGFVTHIPGAGNITTGFTSTVRTYLSYSYLARHQIEIVTYKSINRNPDQIIGKVGGKVLSLTTYHTGRSTSGSGNGMISSNLTFPNIMIDRSVNSLNNSWYEISESWGPTPIVTSEIIDIP